MGNLLRILVAVAVLSVPAAAADIDLPGLPIEGITEAALEGNIDIQRSEIGLAQARRAVDTKTIENTRLSLSGGYTYSVEDAGPDNPPAVSGSANLDIPVVPAIEIGGQINTEGTGSATLSIHPFADSQVTFRESEAVEKAILNLRYLEKSVLAEVEGAFLDTLIEQSNTELSEASFKLSEWERNTIEEAYALDAATYDELFDAEQAVVNARKNYFASLNSEAASKKTLANLLGISGDGLTMPEMSLDDLLNLVETRKGSIENLERLEPVSQTVESLEIEYRSLGAQLDDTPAYQPDVSLSLGIDYPLTRLNGSVSVSLSPAQFTGEERQDVLDEIELKEAELSNARYNLHVEVSIAEKSLAIAEQALAYSLADLERRQSDLEEVTYLQGLGELTKLDLAQARLSLDLAEASAFSSAADLYTRQSALAAFYL